jgi:hypothetical protein
MTSFSVYWNLLYDRHCFQTFRLVIEAQPGHLWVRSSASIIDDLWSLHQASVVYHRALLKRRFLLGRLPQKVLHWLSAVTQWVNPRYSTTQVRRTRQRMSIPFRFMLSLPNLLGNSTSVLGIVSNRLYAYIQYHATPEVSWHKSEH